MRRTTGALLLFVGIVLWNFVCATMGLSVLHNNIEAVVCVVPTVMMGIGILIGKGVKW